MQTWHRLALTLPVFFIVAACSGPQTTADIDESEVIAPDETDDGSSVSTEGAIVEDVGAVTNPLSPGVTFTRDAINDPTSPLGQKVIYFGFNESSIMPEYLNLITEHATYLSDYPSVRVRLEGNTDERGTREYNIALGEQRANSVAELMLLQGVSVDQIITVSYGEEFPAALEHDESAWMLNRRVEIVYETQ